MSGLQFMALGGRVVNNYAEGVLVNNTALQRIITVPSDTFWLVSGGFMQNGDSVTRTCRVNMEDASTNVILRIADDTVATTDLMALPNNKADKYNFGGGLIFAAAGYRFNFYWTAGGASTGGTSKSSLVVLEVDVT